MATTAFGRLAVDVEPGGTGRCVVLVRPEQIVLHEHPGADELSGRVLDYQFYGHDAVVRIAPDGPCGATTIIARQPGSVVFEPGTRSDSARRARCAPGRGGPERGRAGRAMTPA